MKRSSALFIGLDVGTTVLKAAVFEKGTAAPLASRSFRLEIDLGPDGRREQDPSALKARMKEAFAGLRKDLGSDWSRVAGLGLAAQGGSGAVVDRRTGRPRTPMTLWNDARAYSMYQEIEARHPASFWRSFSLRDGPGMGLARLAIILRTAPQLISDQTLYVGAGEFLYFHLTESWRQDGCHAHQTGCYDARRDVLTERPLKEIGVPVSFVAPLRKGHATQPLSEKAALETGLRIGIPVAGPYNDHEAGYLSSTGLSPKPLECSLGTAWVGSFIVPRDRGYGSPFHLPVPAPVGKGLLSIQPLLTGNITWDWALRTFVHPDLARALRLQETLFKERLLPPAGLMALPWLNRPNLLEPDATGSASIWGLGPSTRCEDLVRAVAAALCLEMERVFEPVRDRKVVDSVLLGGGAAKGNVFCRLLGSLFAPLPVYRTEESEWMGARGCLYAHDPRLARVAARRVETLRGRDLPEVVRARALYRELYHRLYGDFRAGRPYRCGRLS